MLRIVTVEPQESPARSFLAAEFSRTWENRQDTCFYAGSGQAGRSGEIEAVDDSVIEGRYSDYLVGGEDDIFEPEFEFSRFEDERCQV